MKYFDKIKRRLKTKGMPKVYYFNLDCDTERKQFMESQFHKYGIAYERVSQSKYTEKNIKDWALKFEDSDRILQMNYDYRGSFVYPANFLNHLKLMKSWLLETSEDYLMVMEDDYDISLIDYWHFNWQYLIDNLPVDWEAFKLNDDHPDLIKFFIHPVDKTSFASFGSTIFKRSFVSKLVETYYSSGKIKAAKNRSMKNFRVENSINDSFNVDVVFTMFGSVYTAPLITTEASLCAEPGEPLKKNSSKDVFAPIQRACHQWWRNERDMFTVDDFFYYNKPNDDQMTLRINLTQQH